MAERLATKAGPTALKQAARLIPSQAAPSHEMPAETRAAMEQQRAGERANLAAPAGPPAFVFPENTPGIGSTPGPFNAPKWQRLEANQLEDYYNALDAGAASNVGPAQSGGGLQAPMPEGPTGGMGVGGGLGAGISGGLGALGAGYGLYQGIQGNNPMGAALSGAGLVGNASQFSSAVGGPSIGSLAGQTAGNVAGPALGALGGAYGLYSGIQNENVPQAVAGGLGAVGGGLSAASAAGLLGAGAGAIGSAATGVGAVVAAAVIMDAIMNSPLKYDLGERKPSSAEISRLAGTQAVQNLARQLPSVVSLPQLARIMNTQWSPHDELQIMSSGAANSDEFKTAIGALHNESYLGQGQGADWVDPFVRGLDVKYGETGKLDKSDPLSAWMMKSQIAQGLPDLPAYQQLKADMAPGGSLYEAERARVGTQQGWMAGMPYGYSEYDQATPGKLNTFDPYTWQGVHPDGTPFQLSPQAMQDYSINPYTYGIPGYEGSAGFGVGPGGGQSGEQTNFNPPQIFSNAHPSLQPGAINPYIASGMQAFDMSKVPAQQGGMAVPASAPTAGAIDPGVQAASAGKRSPTFATPELDNRAEAMAGKLGGPAGQAGDQGIPFGMAGKRMGPAGGMGVNGGMQPGGGPRGNAPFGGVPRGGMMPQQSGGRTQPRQQRTGGTV